MASKIIKLISDAQSLADSFVTDPIPIGPYVDNIAFNIDATAVTDNVGVFTIEHRIRKDYRLVSAWGELCLSFNPTLENADAVKIIYLNQAPIGEIRLVFTVAGSSPDGVVDIWYSGRDM